MKGIISFSCENAHTIGPGFLLITFVKESKEELSGGGEASDRNVYFTEETDMKCHIQAAGEFGFTDIYSAWDL